MKLYFKHEKGFTKEGRIFCEACCVPDIETDDELLNVGWLPSMEEKNVWYQSRSCRLNMEDFYISPKRKNIINRLNVNFFTYSNNQNIDDFFKSYYLNKSFDIFDLYENCSEFFNILIAQVEYEGEVVGYARFTERKDSNIFLNLSYSEKFPKLSLGTVLFFILSNYTKTQNKKYLYIYESYKNVYEYKESFTNVEIWNGIKWVSKNEKW